MRSQPWNVKQLYEAMQREMAKCQTDCERRNCYAICAREIVEWAEKWQKERKLTPVEESIISSL